MSLHSNLPVRVPNDPSTTSQEDEKPLSMPQAIYESARLITKVVTYMITSCTIMYILGIIAFAYIGGVTISAIENIKVRLEITTPKQYSPNDEVDYMRLKVQRN